MTTISFKDGIMAADRLAINGQGRKMTMTKIHKIDGHLIGISGSVDISIALLSWFQNGKSDEYWPELQHDERECTMMVVTPEGKIHIYERYPLPIVFEDTFHAIGSGGDFALAAMSLGCDAVKAIAVAAELDAYTGHGVDVLRLGEKLDS